MHACRTKILQHCDIVMTIDRSSLRIGHEDSMTCKAGTVFSNGMHLAQIENRRKRSNLKETPDNMQRGAKLFLPLPLHRRSCCWPLTITPEDEGRASKNDSSAHLRSRVECRPETPLRYLGRWTKTVQECNAVLGREKNIKQHAQPRGWDCDIPATSPEALHINKVSRRKETA